MTKSGGKAEFEDTYIGAAYTDIIQSLFDRTHTFIFTDISLEFMTIELPSSTQIQNAVKSRDVTFPDFVTFLSSKIRMPDFHQYRQIQG